MNNIVIVILLATIGGLIGWVTNILAIKLMFRPIDPIKVPVLNIEIIGLIPKRKNEIAKNIGQVIQDEFISIEDIMNNLIQDEDKERVNEFVKLKIQNVVNEKMSFIPTPFKAMVQGYIDDIVDEEIGLCINELSEEMIQKASSRIDIQQMVEDKINELDLEELEKIIIDVAKKELKHIEILGLILGFVIGLIQGIIIMVI